MLTQINTAVWTAVMLPAMIVMGICLVFRCKGGFIFRPKTIWKNTLGAPKREGGVSSFSALCTALAGSIGVGNTVGVAAALILGGAGAIFWMWIAGLCGMGIKYAEVYLSVKYRRGEVGGGPMDLLRHALGLKKAASVVGVLFLISSFGMGNLSQSGAAVHAVENAFGISPVIPAVLLCALLLWVLWGGVRSVTSFTSLAIPFFSAVYCLFCLILIFLGRERLPAVFSDIFSGGFGFRSLGCGFSAALFARGARVGFSRGLFSNEAGMGSTPIAYGMSNETDPAVAGMWGVVEVFVDTMLICTMTGVALLVSPHPPAGDAGEWMMAVFSVLGRFGSAFLAISIAVFAFFSMVAWGLYGQQAIGWLGGNLKKKRLYVILFCTVGMGGAFFAEEQFFTVSDLTNALVCLPNILCLFLLLGEVKFPQGIKTTSRKQSKSKVRVRSRRPR